MALQQAGNLLAEGPPPTAQDRTFQPPYTRMDDDRTAVDRHVRHRPAVIPVHPATQGLGCTPRSTASFLTCALVSAVR
jgi:hypothetical protein